MNAPILNPRIEIVRARDRYTLLAPRRARPLRTTEVARGEGAVFEILRAVSEGEAVSMDLDDATWSRLEEIGLLVSPDELSRELPFTCPLPEAATASTAGADLRVNPTLEVGVGAPAHAWVEAPSAGRHRARGRRHLNPYADDRAWATLTLPHLPTPVSFSLTSREREVIASLRPGSTAPDHLDPATRDRLVRAGVLESRDARAAQATAWRRAVGDAARAFADDRVATLPEMLHPATVAALRGHYRALIDEGYAAFDETLGRNRYCMHDEPVARALHRALAPLASEVAGAALKPSYVYLGAYESGAVLVPHRDRDQCPVSISLLLEYAPTERSSWPLCVRVPRAEGSDAVVALLQSPGDGAFFDGTTREHWRPSLPEGHRSMSLFFHFVPADFAGRLD